MLQEDEVAHRLAHGVGRLLWGWEGKPPELGWIEHTSSHLQNCSRKVLLVSQALKVGWAIPWIPLAASAGHCWRPVAWRRSLTLFSQVPTLKTLAGGPAPNSAGQILPYQGQEPLLEVRGLRELGLSLNLSSLLSPSLGSKGAGGREV